MYKLPGPPSEEEGVRFYETYSNKTHKYSRTLIDDLKILQPTLGRRRLKLAIRGEKLFNFKIACFSLGEVVKLSKGATMWLDSKGVLFELPRTSKFKLEAKKIKATYQKTGYVILDVEGEATRFRSLYGPPSLEHQALIMYSGNIRLFYGYCLPGAKFLYRKV